MKKLILIVIVILSILLTVYVGSLPPSTHPLLPGQCVVDGTNIQTALDNSACVVIAVKGSTDKANPRQYFQASWYNLKRSGVTLRADGYVVIRAIEIPGNSNTVTGFIVNDPKNNAGIRTQGNFNLIENNEITNTLQDGVWFWGVGNTFRNNYIHDLGGAVSGDSDPHRDCFQTWDWNWETSDILFENNICDHTRTSGSNQIVMLSGSAHDLTFRNNTFIMHDAGYSPLALYGGKNFKIEGNYFCNTTGRGSPAIYLDGGTGVTLTGNTYAGYSTLVQGSGVVLNSGNIRGSLPCTGKPVDEPPTVPPTSTKPPTRIPTTTPTLNLPPTVTPTEQKCVIIFEDTEYLFAACKK